MKRGAAWAPPLWLALICLALLPAWLDSPDAAALLPLAMCR